MLLGSGTNLHPLPWNLLSYEAKKLKPLGQVKNPFIPGTERDRLHSYEIALILFCLNKAKAIFLGILYANFLFKKIFPWIIFLNCDFIIYLFYFGLESSKISVLFRISATPVVGSTYHHDGHS